MANEKVLNTRILLKYDTFENWQKSKGILKPGEVAVCTVAGPDTKEVNSVVAPQVLFKVGDGTNTFAQLPWASGLAADVYSWAKAANKPEYNATEIKELDKYIGGKVQDTNTTYQIIVGSTAGMYQLQKKEIDGIWANEGAEFGIDEDAIKGLITTAQNKANSAYTLAEGKLGKSEKAADSAKLGGELPSHYATSARVEEAYNLANGKQSPATTLAGYGITDAKIDGGVITLGKQTITPLTDHQDISGKADKTAAVGSFEGTGSATITPVFVGGGKGTAFTVNKVAEATKATNVGLTATGTGTASITVKAGSGTAASFTVNNVTEAGHATKATQDNNGKVISEEYATKTELTTGLGGKLGLHAKADDSAKLEGKTKAEVIAEARVGYATEDYVDSAVAGAVQYYGVVNSEADLGKDMTSSASSKPAAKVGKGDFYRVGAAFGGLKIGDLLIAKADQASYTKVANYDRVAQENYKGTVTSVTVTGNNGLTGTGTVSSSGTITLSHADTSSQASSTNSGRTYIQSVELDEYGHVTKLATGTETVVDTNTAHTHKAGAKLAISGNGGISGEVTYSHATVAEPTKVEGGSGRTYITELVADGYGHITGYKTSTETVVDHDTKNTAGATNTSGKLFLVGAAEQTANPQTYSETNAFIQSGALYSEGKKVLTDHQAHQAIKQLDTTSATALSANAAEEIKGSGKIQLHKIAKTGTYSDLIGTPTIGNGTFTVSGGKGLTGSGSSTANQTGATSATLAVGAGTGITVNENDVAVTDYNNILTHKGGNNLQDEAGNTIIFCCGTSDF